MVVKRWRADATNPCPIGGSDKFKLLGASISTADARFAEANVNDSRCTFTLGYILRRRSKHGGRWHVVQRLLDSAQSCGSLRAHVPEVVLRDFGIEGQLSGQGGFGPC